MHSNDFFLKKIHDSKLLNIIECAFSISDNFL